jgi:hypothetical protein
MPHVVNTLAPINQNRLYIYIYFVFLNLHYSSASLREQPIFTILWHLFHPSIHATKLLAPKNGQQNLITFNYTTTFGYKASIYFFSFSSVTSFKSYIELEHFCF